jgi:hypothetical protein
MSSFETGNCTDKNGPPSATNASLGNDSGQRGEPPFHSVLIRATTALRTARLAISAP